MKHLVSLFLLLVATCPAWAQPKVMAHRGWYTREGSWENTINSLQNAQELKVYGSEFDVQLTSDDSLVIYHGPIIHGTKKDVRKITFNEVRAITLPGGHQIPTLQEYFDQGKKCPEVKLMLEVKKQLTKERDQKIVRDIIALAKKNDILDQIEWLSFQIEVCDDILSLLPDAAVTFNGSGIGVRPISEAVYHGCNNVSYDVVALLNRPYLIEDAHRMGIKATLWLVNSYGLMDWGIANGVDILTSDYPDKTMAYVYEGKKIGPERVFDKDELAKTAPGYVLRGEDKKLVCMDLDATITQHKTPLTEENRKALDELAKRYKLLIVGAGDVKRIHRQLLEYPVDILGNYGMQEARIENGELKIVREDKVKTDKKFFIRQTNALRKKYGYTSYIGDPLEFHEAGMVTFGLLGTKTDRDTKLAFDPDRKKRLKMYDEVCNIFKDYTVFIGGSSSFDFAPKPYNKYDAIMRYARENGYSAEQIIFIGDDFEDGGVDSHVRLKGLDYIKIDDYKTFPKKIKPLLK